MIKITLTTEVGTVLTEYDIPDEETWTYEVIGNIIDLSRYVNENRKTKRRKVIAD